MSDQKQSKESPSGDGPDSTPIQQEEARLNKAVRESRRKNDATFQLSAEERERFVDAARPAFGLKTGTASVYHLMPKGLSRDEIEAGEPIWRIELHGLSAGAPPLGIDIAGDVVVGRGDKHETGVDINMDHFDGLQRGVSRRHAMLRPSKRAVYLLDLGSTNGTMHNAMPLNQGMTRPLTDNDTLTFGQVSCTLRVIDGPVTRDS